MVEWLSAVPSSQLFVGVGCSSFTEEVFPFFPFFAFWFAFFSLFKTLLEATNREISGMYRPI